MHKIDIPRHIIDRAMKRRGRLHIFEDIDPARTVHLVVDMQNGFMAPGEQGETPAARDIVANVNRISAALRAAGGAVAFVQNTFDAGTETAWSVRFDYFSHPERRARSLAAFAPGSFGHQLWPGLAVEPGDLKIWKRRFSPFVAGSSDLHDVLTGRGVDTLILTGTVTNACCESTARDAMMLNYKVIFVADGTAAHSDEEHNATLVNMLSNFADVMTADEVIACLARAARKGRAAE